MKYRISKKKKFIYKKFITRLRYITANFKTIDKIIFNKNNKNKNNQKSKNAFNQKQNNFNKKKNNNRFNNFRQKFLYQNLEYKYFKSLINRIVKENRY